MTFSPKSRLFGHIVHNYSKFTSWISDRSTARASLGAAFETPCFRPPKDQPGTDANIAAPVEQHQLPELPHSELTAQVHTQTVEQLGWNVQQQQCQQSSRGWVPDNLWCKLNMPQHAAANSPFLQRHGYTSSSKPGNHNNNSVSADNDISPSCDVPLNHPLNQRQPTNAYKAPKQTSSSSSSSNTTSSSSTSSRSASSSTYDGNLSSSSGSGGSYNAPWRLATHKIEGGTLNPDEFKEHGQILSTFYQEGMHGGLGRKFRRKVPLFQVIEFYANGTAVEDYRPCTPQQLGLHPRDVVLFAPISRLAAPQRATIVVHDGKILVKTEIVKAIITADKAVLIKGSRDADTQKLSQNILAANDQRLMAIRLAAQQQQQQEAARAASSPLAAHGCGKAASAADLLRAAEESSGRFSHSAKTWQGLSSDADRGFGSARTHSSRSGQGLGSGGELKDVPFEMLALEVLLDATTEYFYTKVQHLHWMLESIAADIRQPSMPQGAMDKAHQLIPIQKFLTQVKNDVKETNMAIKGALANNEMLEELCLSWHKQQQQRAVWMTSELARQRARDAEEGYEIDDTDLGAAYSIIYGQNKPNRNDAASAGPLQQVRMLTEMLESYEREIQSLEGSINEAEEDLDNTRSLWHMQLDSSRNHIIMVNLWLSMLNISVMASNILPAFFGMNLEGPLPTQDSTYFFFVMGASLALSALSYPASRFWYTHNWRKINQNKVFEHKMLRVLLVQNIEDIDGIVRAAKRYRSKFVDRSMFRKIIMEGLGSRAMTTTHIDFLWQCYDRDRDGFIQECEMIKPLNTYHHSTNGTTQMAASEAAGLQHVGSIDSATSSSSALESSYHGPDPWEERQQQQGWQRQPPMQRQRRWQNFTPPVVAVQPPLQQDQQHWSQHIQPYNHIGRPDASGLHHDDLDHWQTLEHPDQCLPSFDQPDRVQTLDQAARSQTMDQAARVQTLDKAARPQALSKPGRSEPDHSMYDLDLETQQDWKLRVRTEWDEDGWVGPNLSDDDSDAAPPQKPRRVQRVKEWIKEQRERRRQQKQQQAASSLTDEDLQQDDQAHGAQPYASNSDDDESLDLLRARLRNEPDSWHENWEEDDRFDWDKYDQTGR